MPEILVSGDTGLPLMGIFAGVVWREGVKRQWVVKNGDFSALCLSSEALEIEPTLLYSIIKSLTGFPMTPKQATFNALERPFYVCDDDHFGHFANEFGDQRHRGATSYCADI